MSFFELDFDPTASENAPMVACYSAVFSSPDVLGSSRVLIRPRFKVFGKGPIRVSRVKAIRRK